jgi:hypothetical protein
MSETTGGHHAESVIKVKCSAGHVVTCAPPSLHVTHGADVLLGYRCWCNECDTFDSVVASPDRIAMLLEMGVELAPEATDQVLPVISAQRRVVSMKYLLDDEAIAGLTDVPGSQELLERP